MDCASEHWELEWGVEKIIFMSISFWYETAYICFYETSNQLIHGHKMEDEVVYNIGAVSGNSFENILCLF